MTSPHIAVSRETRPRLLDLFCKAGGAAKGYADAGFEVVGVDIEPQPNYPFKFIEGDALHVLWSLVIHRAESRDLGVFDAIHASPPCQDYSVTASLHDAKYPRLIEPVRELLIAAGVPYVIENVEGARGALRNPVRLCGSSFGLGVRRHRLFEMSIPVTFVPPCAHHLQPEPVDVTGTGASRLGDRTDGKGGNSRKPRNLAHAREVMGIDWMTRPELSEAVPPPMTRWIGEQLIAAITSSAEAVA